MARLRLRVLALVFVLTSSTLHLHHRARRIDLIWQVRTRTRGLSQMQMSARNRVAAVWGEKGTGFAFCVVCPPAKRRKDQQVFAKEQSSNIERARSLVGW